MKKILYVVLPLMLKSSVVLAEITPRQGDYDPRVRVVEYNPANVVKLHTFYGVSTHVQFGEGETIKDVAAGDDQAWTIAPRGQHLFIKPKAQKADTNLTIVTDKRVYEFIIYVEPRSIEDQTAWKNPKLIYALTFQYPEEEAERRLKKSHDQIVKEKLANGSDNTADSPTTSTMDNRPTDNLDYWVAGSEEISPTSARDDGRFTYLTFTNNRDMPAIYTVDAEGNEALVNTNVEGNTIIIHRVVPKLTLRKGIAVACLANKGFKFDGGRDNTTGTVAPDVKRVIRGQAQ